MLKKLNIFLVTSQISITPPSPTLGGGEILRFKPRQKFDKLVGGGFKSKKLTKKFCGASRQNMYNKNFCGASRRNMKFKLSPDFFARFARLFHFFSQFARITSFFFTRFARISSFFMRASYWEKMPNKRYFLEVFFVLGMENVKKKTLFLFSLMYKVQLLGGFIPKYWQPIFSALYCWFVPPHGNLYFLPSTDNLYFHPSADSSYFLTPVLTAQIFYPSITYILPQYWQLIFSARYVHFYSSTA